MINKYAEIRDRLVLYNACKGVLRIKQAMIATPGSTGGMTSNFSNLNSGALMAGIRLGTIAGSPWSKFTGANTSFQQQPQGFGQQQQAYSQPQKPMSSRDYFKTYGQNDVENKWTDWIPFSGGKAARQRSANAADYNNYVKQMQAQNRQMLNQQQAQWQQQQVPQGVDPNQWKKFQQWQQMMM